MKELTKVVQQVRESVWKEGAASKLADVFEAKAMKELTEWLNEDHNRAFKYCYFIIEIQSLSFKEYDVILEKNPVNGFTTWRDIEDEGFKDITYDGVFDESFDDSELYLEIYKPFLDELAKRGYDVRYNKVTGTICPSFDA